MSALTVAVSLLGLTDPTPLWELVWPDHPASAVEWCGVFVSACFARAGRALPKVEPAVTSGFTYCPDAVTWAKHAGLWTVNPAPGDVVLYDWNADGVADHTGIVESVAAQTITAVEGNTGSPPAVRRQTRSYRECLGFIRSGGLMTATGPDVSSYNHPNGEPINWPAVRAAGHTFAFVKATEGTGYVNPFFTADYDGARAAGLTVGAYLFLDAVDGAAQADHFHAAAGAQIRPGDLPVTLDFEAQGVTHAMLHAARERLHTYGYATMTYSYGPFVRANIPPDCAVCAADPLWLAAYQSSQPGCPPPWQTITFWQDSDAAPMPGMPGGTSDRSLYLGSNFPALTTTGDGDMTPEQAAQLADVAAKVNEIYHWEGGTPNSTQERVTRLEADMLKLLAHFGIS